MSFLLIPIADPLLLLIPRDPFCGVIQAFSASQGPLVWRGKNPGHDLLLIYKKSHTEVASTQ